MPPRSVRPPEARAATISLSAVVAVQHDVLLALQRVAALAVGARGGGGVGDVVARLPLLVRQRQRQPALGDGRHQLLEQRLVAGMAQRAAAQHDGGEIGLDDEAAAERLGDDHGLGQPLAEPAVLLGEGHGQQPEVGILLPQGGAVALGLLHVAHALAELAVAVGEQPLDAVLQLALLVVEIEIHGLRFSDTLGRAVAGAYCDPRMLAAAMPAPISSVPPMRLKMPMARALPTSLRAREATRP